MRRWRWLGIGTVAIVVVSCSLINAPDDPNASTSSGIDAGGSGSGGSLGKALGQACDAASECASGNCVDGVCCDLACDGACESCNQAGELGNCMPHAGGTDPEDECPGDCNGVTGCAGIPGQICTAASECDSGFCVDGVCCETDCASVCFACAEALNGVQDGLCTPVVAGTDPDDECATGTCDGIGNCGCPVSTGVNSIGGPISAYTFCWYLSAPGINCDAVCAEIGGMNYAIDAEGQWPDACSAATPTDVSTMFYMQGNPAGWSGATSATAYHTLGYGYMNAEYYGKCASGTVTGNGSYPNDPNQSTTRAVVCPCFKV